MGWFVIYLRRTFLFTQTFSHFKEEDNCIIDSLPPYYFNNIINKQPNSFREEKKNGFNNNLFCWFIKLNAHSF